MLSKCYSYNMSCCSIVYPAHSRLSGWCHTRPALDPADPEQPPANSRFPYKVLFPSFRSSSIRGSSWAESRRHLWLLTAQLTLTQQGTAGCRGRGGSVGPGYFPVTCRVFPESIFPANTMGSCRTACRSLFLTSTIFLAGKCSSAPQPPREE